MAKVRELICDGITGRQVMSDYSVQRTNMVNSQLRPNQVGDTRILDAMGELPRERFVPASLRDIAYMDEEVCVETGSDGSPGRWLMAPTPLARLIQLAEVGPSDLVLDIGCATGYSTALLARLADSVVGVEASPALCEAAGKTLSELEADNAVVVCSKLTEGYAEEGPYDVIRLGGGVPSVPDMLFDQLKPGGRLATIILKGSVGQATLFRRLGNEITATPAFDCGAPLLPGFEPVAEFVF